MLPNVPPKLFSISAIAIGYLLIDDSTANEQNALGNWLMLVAQVLSTNAFYRALMQERGLEPRESTESGKNNSYTFGNNEGFYNNYSGDGSSGMDQEYYETLLMLEKMIRALEKEVLEIKRKMDS